MTKGTTVSVLHGQVWAKQNESYVTRAGAHKRLHSLARWKTKKDNHGQNEIIE